MTIFRLFLIVTLCFYSLAAEARVPGETITTIKILGINDFHGQVSTGRRVNDRAVGGAAVLAAYLGEAQRNVKDNTVITMMGDQVGASSPVSGLLHDEPTIMFLNALANSHCSKQNLMDAQCNMVATVGNHEFDKGQKAMFDLMYGTDNPPTEGWLPLPHYPGAVYPYISANIVDAKTGKPLFPPYVIKKINGIPVAFIGAVTKNAPDVILNTNIEGIQFLDEAEAINHYIPEIKAQGVRIIIVLIHEGGNQTTYEGDTQEKTSIDGRITDIVNRLDDSIDVVMAGHVHQFLNAFIPNRHGKKILVTEAGSYSSAFSEVTLLVDSNNFSVVNKSARIISTFADQFPGTSPVAEITKLVKLAEDKVIPMTNRQIGVLQTTLTKISNADGESSLGNLITDAFKSYMQTDMAIFNKGGIRSDLYAGKITWGDIYSCSHFQILSLKCHSLAMIFMHCWSNNGVRIKLISCKYPVSLIHMMILNQLGSVSFPYRITINLWRETRFTRLQPIIFWLRAVMDFQYSGMEKFLKRD